MNREFVADQILEKRGMIDENSRITAILMGGATWSGISTHNHPSGNLKPSQSDLDLTHKIVEGGKLLDIRVLDHLIITADGYYSFADEGLM